jgi:hypothetical protein
VIKETRAKRNEFFANKKPRCDRVDCCFLKNNSGDKILKRKSRDKKLDIGKVGQYLGMLLQNYLICARFKFNELPPLE